MLDEEVPKDTEEQPLVLLVDDFTDARVMFREYLEMSGFRVAEAKNGQEAFDTANALVPDIILMDLTLPIVNGWEATRLLKQCERTKAIPVVAFSGQPLGASKLAALFDSVITKPCLPDRLVERLRNHIGCRAR